MLVLRCTASALLSSLRQARFRYLPRPQLASAPDMKDGRKKGLLIYDASNARAARVRFDIRTAALTPCFSRPLGGILSQSKERSCDRPQQLRSARARHAFCRCLHVSVFITPP